MTRFLLWLVFGASAALGLAAPAAAWRGRGRHDDPRADARDRPPGGWGHLSRRLTLQALRFDEAGELVAIGVLAARSRPLGAARRKCGAPVYHPRGVTGPAGHLQDPRRGSGAAHVAPLVQALTLVPVVLNSLAAPKAERLLQRTLCNHDHTSRRNR